MGYGTEKYTLERILGKDTYTWLSLLRVNDLYTVEIPFPSIQRPKYQPSGIFEIVNTNLLELIADRKILTFLREYAFAEVYLNLLISHVFPDLYGLTLEEYKQKSKKLISYEHVRFNLIKFCKVDVLTRLGQKNTKLKNFLNNQIGLFLSEITTETSKEIGYWCYTLHEFVVTNFLDSFLENLIEDTLKKSDYFRLDNLEVDHLFGYMGPEKPTEKEREREKLKWSFGDMISSLISTMALIKPKTKKSKENHETYLSIQGKLSFENIVDKLDPYQDDDSSFFWKENDHELFQILGLTSDELQRIAGLEETKYPFTLVLLNPSNANFWKNLGRRYLRTEGITSNFCFWKAHELNPNDYSSLILLAISLLQQPTYHEDEIAEIMTILHDRYSSIDPIFHGTIEQLSSFIINN